MTKKIKFPLEMKNGVKVRSLEELKENFDLEKLVSYFIDGRLLSWLNDRYYEDEAQQLANININSQDFKVNICKIFGMDFIEEDLALDIEGLEYRNQKIAKLRQYTDNEEVIKNIDSVAFDQEELSDLLDENKNIIYLCNGEFRVPLNKKNITYIGINNPIIKLSYDRNFNLEEFNIEIQDSLIKCIGNGKIINKVKKKIKDLDERIIFRLDDDILIQSNLDGSNKKVIDEFVEDFCTYRDKVFFLKFGTTLYSIDIYNEEKKEILRGLSESHYRLINTDFGVNKRNRILCTEGYLIVKQSNCIFRTDHDGYFREELIKSNSSHIRDICLVGEELFYLKSNDEGIYRINIKTKDNIFIDNARRMILHNNLIYYIKYSRYDGMVEKICSCDLEGKNKKVIGGDTSWIHDFQCRENKIFYSIQDGYKLDSYVTKEILIEK